MHCLYQLGAHLTMNTVHMNAKHLVNGMQQPFTDAANKIVFLKALQYCSHVKILSAASMELNLSAVLKVRVSCLFFDSSMLSCCHGMWLIVFVICHLSAKIETIAVRNLSRPVIDIIAPG